MPDVLLATCADYPEGDEDGAALVAALDAAGGQVWDDPDASWSPGRVVLRSTWDYTLQRAPFLNWARSVPRLANPFDVVAWNSDKRYLCELADAGPPTVPSRWAARGKLGREWARALRRGEHHRPRPVRRELAAAEQAVAALRKRFGADLLYTRVDLLPGPDGPVVIEVEVIEPSLFLAFAASAQDRFAAAIKARI